MLTRGEIHDDVLAEHVVTVSEVRMSPDLKVATIYIMPLGGNKLLTIHAHREAPVGLVVRRVDVSGGEFRVEEATTTQRSVGAKRAQADSRVPLAVQPGWGLRIRS